jgi:DNA-binding transcriptional ArsR family regulator
MASNHKAPNRTPRSTPHRLLAHPLRARLWTAFSNSDYSPNELAKELDEPLGNVSYHVKVLLDAGVIELVATQPRRGAIEHYYRAVDTAESMLTPRLLLTTEQADRFQKQLAELVVDMERQAPDADDADVEIALAAFRFPLDSAYGSA